MNYFFGFGPGREGLLGRVDWIFTINHLFLLFIVVGALFALYYGIHAKSKRGIFTVKLVLASIMLVLEVGRIIWRFGEFRYVGIEEFTSWHWFRAISFAMCAIMKWVTITTLVLSAFLKSNNRALQILYNILFGCAMIGGILAFVYPDMIGTQRSLFHFMSLQTVISHILLIFVPLYLIKIGELKIRVKSLWMVLLGYILVGSVAMSASQISGQNFSFALYSPLIRGIGLSLPFPMDLLLTFLAVFAIVSAIYAIFELVHRRKNKDDSRLETSTWVRNLWTLPTIVMMLGFAVSVPLVFVIPLLLPESPVESWLGLVCLFPILIAVSGLVVGDSLSRRSSSNPTPNEESI